MNITYIEPTLFIFTHNVPDCFGLSKLRFFLVQCIYFMYLRINFKILTK